MAKQVQQLRFVEFEQWFPPRRDERASEGFYTPLQEDFYNAYLNSGAIFRSQRVCVGVLTPIPLRLGLGQPRLGGLAH